MKTYIDAVSKSYQPELIHQAPSCIYHGFKLN